MGDLFGDRQSGMPGFRIADPLRDEALNAAAGIAADRILAADPALERKEHLALRRTLTTQFQRGLELFRVG
jgi:ATP-dependent DNA helicase RecG